MNFQFFRKPIGLVSAVFILSAVTLFAVFYPRPIAQIGEWKIYKQDVNYRDQVIRLSFPEEKRSLGQLQLEKSAVNLQILKNNGFSFSDLQIEDEIKRIDQNTKNPEQLQQIKQIFKDDPAAYRRNFILPLLADRTIYIDFFLNNEKIHAESLGQATDFIAATKDKPEDFRRLATEKKYKILDLTVSMKNGLTWVDRSISKPNTNPPKSEGNIPMKIQIANNKNQELLDRVNADMSRATKSGQNREAEQWYESVLSFLKEGQVTLVPINQEKAWLVARLEKHEPNDIYRLEVVTFQKLDYGIWLEQEKAKVKIDH